LEEIVDLNGDGLPDLVVNIGGALQVGFGTGSGFQPRANGAFQNGSEYFPPAGSAALGETELRADPTNKPVPTVWATVFDLNGDGIADLPESVANPAAIPPFLTQVALGLGDGTFTKATVP